MKINSRFIILTVFLIIGSVGLLTTQASTNQVNEINLAGATTTINVYDFYTNDHDYDGFEDTVSMSIELYHSGFNGNVSGVYVDVYDANVFPYKFLSNVLSENYTYWGSNYNYFYPTYNSEIQGTLFFNVTAQVDGVDVHTQSFYAYNLHEYLVPQLGFSYLNWVTYDNDGIDAFDDTLRVEVGIWTANITNWPGSELYIYKQNPVTLNWEYVRNMYRNVQIDSTNTYANVTYEYHITEFGNYRFDLDVYYNEARINSTYYWNNAYVDTLPPVSFSAYVNTFTLDSFDAGIDITFRNYFETVDVYMDVSHDGAGYIGTWHATVRSSGNSIETIKFDGVFPYNGNYTFIFTFYDSNDWYSSIDIFKDFQSAYVGSYVGINNHATFYDNDLDGVPDQVQFENQLQFVNLFGEYYVDMTVYIDDGLGYVQIDYQNSTTFTADGSGTTGFWYWYTPQYSGNYLFVFSVFYDGTSTSVEYYWFGADAGSGNEGVSVSTWVDGYDQDNDFNTDSVKTESYIWYDLFIDVQLDVIFTILLLDQATGVYLNHSMMTESYRLSGSGEFSLNFEFTPDVEGEYEFHFDYYVNGRLLEDYSFTQWWFLSTAHGDKLDLNLWGEPWDDNNDGADDRLSLHVGLSYILIPGANIQVLVEVFFDNTEINSFNESEFLEGNNYREYYWDFNADEVGEYKFKVQVLRDGVFVTENTFYWDTAQSSDPNNGDDSSSTPELPVPAGSMYLFVFALFTAAITIRRKFD